MKDMNRNCKTLFTILSTHLHSITVVLAIFPLSSPNHSSDANKLVSDVAFPKSWPSQHLHHRPQLHITTIPGSIALAAPWSLR